MLSAVVDQFDHALRHCPSIDRNASDSATGTPEFSVGNLVAGPDWRNAGIELKLSAPQTETKDRFQTDSVQPGGRTCIPGPAAAAGMRRGAIDIRTDHVRLDLVPFNRSGRSCVADWVEQVEQL